MTGPFGGYYIQRATSNGQILSGLNVTELEHSGLFAGNCRPRQPNNLKSNAICVVKRSRNQFQLNFATPLMESETPKDGAQSRGSPAAN